MCGLVACCTLCVAANGQDITGAGATAPYPLYSRWFAEYNALHPGVRINYQSLGSGAGIRQVSQGVIDFGASDIPLSQTDLAESPMRLLQVPTLLGAVVPVYRLAGVKDGLHFSPQVLAAIYLGVITRWNDPRLQRDNPGVALPDHGILAIHRSDGAGTTFIFTEFLSKASPAFLRGVGCSTSVNWPAGIGAKGSEGVAAMVRDNRYAIGYVEPVYAQNGLMMGTVRNRAGQWISPSAESLQAAAHDLHLEKPSTLENSLTDSPMQGAYPIVSFTWLLLPAPSAKGANSGKSRALADLVNWMLDHAQAEAGSMSYAPLPAEVAAEARRAVQELR